MMETKQHEKKTDKVLGYHYIQSFKPGEVTPEAPGLGPFVNIAGNIALLFPLGLFLPLFWRWFERAGRTIRWCFGTSLSIELIQLAAGGVTSADDLLLNTLGGALGFAAARLLMRACPKLAPQGEGRAEWAAPLVCWLVIIAASTISDLLILW